MNKTENTDIILVKNLQSEDSKVREKAATEFYNDYSQRLKWFFMRNPVVKRMTLEIEDLVAITLERCIRRISTYNPSYALSTWVYNVASNLLIDEVRKLEDDSLVSLDKENEYGDSLSDTIVDHGSNRPDSILEKSERADVVNAALDNLPEKYAVALRMFFFDGLKYSEISSELGIPVNTAKTLVFEGKKRLGKAIARSHGNMVQTV